MTMFWTARKSRSAADSGMRTLQFMTRPFKASDLQPLPDGASPRPPDFIGVASGKAGTSWWYNLLLGHPQIAPNRLRLKETSYWYHFGCRHPDAPSVATYHEAFASSRHRLCGEWSPGYLTHPLVIENLHHAAPKARILAIVRNPVDRLQSALNQVMSFRFKFMDLEGDRAALYKVHSLFPAAVQESRLAAALRRLFDVCGRDNVLVLQYEQCKRDPATQIARTYRFLGVDDVFRPPDLTAKVHAKPHRLPEFSREERVRLAAYFAEDMRELAALLPDLDQSLWSDFT